MVGLFKYFIVSFLVIGVLFLTADHLDKMFKADKSRLYWVIIGAVILTILEAMK